MSENTATAVIDPAVVVVSDDTVGNSDGGNGRAKPVKSGRARLTWKYEGDRGTGNQSATVNTESGPAVLKVSAPAGTDKADKAWTGSIKVGGKTEKLVEGVSHDRAYYAVTHFHHWDSITGPVKVTETEETSAA